MKKPTAKQIESEITKLKKMKPTVRRRGGFGDDHHAAIDAQIYVLTMRMDLDEVYENYNSREMGGDCAHNVYEAAVEACNWMEGENDLEAPSKGWKELVQK